MIDYEALEVLEAIAMKGSFSGAAEKLCRTQSAISQRIASLEREMGKPLLIRDKPIRPTPDGQKLLNHLGRVRALEMALGGGASEYPMEIAINRDSLETWFQDVLQRLPDHMTLRVTAADQVDTLKWLRDGRVQGCVSRHETALPGCRIVPLGVMRYIPACAPSLRRKFRRMDVKEALQSIPGMIFDRSDQEHALWLEHYFQCSLEETRYLMMPSCQGFTTLALVGKAFGLVPEIEIKHQLEEGSLVSLGRDLAWDIPLFWHQYDSGIAGLDELERLVLAASGKVLRPYTAS